MLLRDCTHHLSNPGEILAVLGTLPLAVRTICSLMPQDPPLNGDAEGASCFESGPES